MHRRLLPLIILENHPFMRYILKRRGVFSTLVERAPAGKLALDEGDKREIETLLETIGGGYRVVSDITGALARVM